MWFYFLDLVSKDYVRFPQNKAHIFGNYFNDDQSLKKIQSGTFSEKVSGTLGSQAPSGSRSTIYKI